jgi:antirestriction protein
MEEGYHGEHGSTEDFAASMTEETTSIPKNLAYYIDYEKMARDWFMSDFFSIEINSKFHIFSHL